MQLCRFPGCDCIHWAKGQPNHSLAKLSVSNETITQLPDNAIVSLILLYPSWAMTLTPLSLSHTMSGRPIPSRPRDLVIIPADVKSVQCFCRIMVLKASCSKEQRNIDANRKKKKKKPSSPNKNFWQFLLLAKAFMFLAWCLLYGPVTKP